MGLNELERLRCLKIAHARGDFVAGDDGYYVYWPESNTHGSLASHHLRWIADELDRMNADWGKLVRDNV